MTTNEQLQLNEVPAEGNAPQSNLNTSFENPIGRGEQPDFSPSPDEVSQQAAQVVVPAAAPRKEAAPVAAPAPEAQVNVAALQEKAGLFDTLMADQSMSAVIDQWAAKKLGKPPIGAGQQEEAVRSQEQIPEWAQEMKRENAALREEVQGQRMQQAKVIYDEFKAQHPDLVKYEREVAEYVQNQQLSLQDAYLLAKAKGNGVNEQQSQTVEGRTIPATTPSPQDDVQARIAAIPHTDGDRTAKATRIAFDAAISQYHQ